MLEAYYSAGSDNELTVYRLLDLLADGKMHGGPALARELGISRSAVWKSIRQLSGLGLGVHSSRDGYQLVRSLEMLDADRIMGCLDEVNRSRIDVIIIHKSIDSTNSALMRRQYKSMNQFYVCAAEHQTAGRGRQGRTWHSPFGANLYLSIAWYCPVSPASWNGLAIACSLAVAEALTNMGIDGLWVKWPNDLYFSDEKIGGILVEFRGEAEGPCVIVVGIGLNISMPATEHNPVDQPWRDLSSIIEGKTLSRNKVAGILINALIQEMVSFAFSGFSGMIERWKSWDRLIGREVAIHEADQISYAMVSGLDESGALLVRGSEGMRRIVAGEVRLKWRDSR